MAGGIFVLNERDELVEMQSANFDSEDQLQKTIARFPRLLASCATESEEEWLLVSREVGIPDKEAGANRWSLDHLFIDSSGVPILVEVKRSADTRIRREVVGQMLDYAANATLYWPIEHLRDAFAAECAKSDEDPDEKLEEFIGNTDQEEFWKTVKTNLQAGRIKLVFVADEIPSELKRIIEFLNEKMDPTEVFGIEIRQFVSGALKTWAPNVVGMTTEAETRKRAGYAQQPREAVPGLAEAVAEFNASAPESIRAQLKRSTYAQIELAPYKGLHYEFMHRKTDGIGVEFHIERKYKGLAEVLKKLSAKIGKINGADVQFDPTWMQGKGRLRVLHGHGASPSVLADTMKQLIAATKSEITSAV